ncbi:hypothetical protein, partial [Nodularia sp. UHCC 0506]|uniref:hypothetical protein n=1 Tax=Nodularia sp. UHCC 0506 TaxID=3110243 RepID=UPI002B1FC68A
IQPQSESIDTATSSTPTNPLTESTIIQPQSENIKSVTTSSENSETTTSSTPINLSTESTIIQPQRETNDWSQISELDVAQSGNDSITASSGNLETTVTHLQPKKETQSQNKNPEIPQLPTVLKNISNFRPFSQVSNLISRSFADETATMDTSINIPVPVSASRSPYIQKSPSQDIPDSWSNISELVGENKIANQPIVVQPSMNENQRDNGLKSRLFQNQKLATINTQNSSYSNQLIQAYRTDNMSILEQNLEETSNEVSRNENTTNTLSEENELKNLDILAREVYKMLKNHLEIEQERRGQKYLGRLPW